MKLVCLILARKGSKRIKNKNLQKVGKKTLVAHTIEFAKKILPTKNIILSTDSPKIRKIGEDYNLKIYNLRPKKFATSNTTSYKSAEYEIKEYEKRNSSVNTIILLQPTSPFRSVKTYKKIIKKFFKKPSQPLITIKRVPLECNKFYKIKRSKLIRLTNKSDREFVYLPNGSFFIISKKILLQEKSFTSRNMQYQIIEDFKENIDIDTWQDLKLAKKLI